jgi:hypothetical protein
MRFANFCAGLVIALASGGCAHVRPATPPNVPEALPATAIGEPRTPVAAAPESEAARVATAHEPVAETLAAARVAPPAVPAPARSATLPTAVPAASASAAPSSAQVKAAPPAARVAPAPVSTRPEMTAPKPPATDTLDLGTLEQRLRETRSIGLFTKLSLKNQVDDLLAQFRSYYRAQGKPPPMTLRPHYDGLLLKVITLLQDGDPPLAAAILASREAIWGILADPVRLSKI